MIKSSVPLFNPAVLASALHDDAEINEYESISEYMYVV